jgi:transcriptional regulator with XRE-family HTH domain
MTPDEMKALRAELGCSARELAGALGVEQGDVLAWERGERFPTKRHVEAMDALRRAGPSAIPRKRKGAPPSPLHALADPELWRLVRKLIAHPELRSAVARLAADYADPIE